MVNNSPQRIPSPLVDDESPSLSLAGYNKTIPLKTSFSRAEKKMEKAIGDLPWLTPKELYTLLAQTEYYKGFPQEMAPRKRLKYAARYVFSSLPGISSPAKIHELVMHETNKRTLYLSEIVRRSLEATSEKVPPENYAYDVFTGVKNYCYTLRPGNYSYIWKQLQNRGPEEAAVDLSIKMFKEITSLLAANPGAAENEEYLRNFQNPRRYIKNRMAGSPDESVEPGDPRLFEKTRKTYRNKFHPRSRRLKKQTAQNRLTVQNAVEANPLVYYDDTQKPIVLSEREAMKVERSKFLLQFCSIYGRSPKESELPENLRDPILMYQTADTGNYADDMDDVEDQENDLIPGSP
jgi:hypothetical protein